MSAIGLTDSHVSVRPGIYHYKQGLVEQVLPVALHEGRQRVIGVLISGEALLYRPQIIVPRHINQIPVGKHPRVNIQQGRQIPNTHNDYYVRI